MKLSNSKIILRAVEPADLDFLFMLETLPEAANNGFSTAPPSRQMLWEYIENYTADIFAAKQLRLIICDAASGERVGTIDISDFDPRDRRGFVGVIVAEPYRRQGYALAALTCLCEYASSTLGMHQLCAIVASGNDASRHLFAGATFKPAGRLRSWLRRGSQYADALIFQKLFA